MAREITRRDFINGASVALSGSLLFPWAQASASEVAPETHYPPALTGLRGSHPGSFEVAHAVRDGKRWTESEIEETGEAYDLVVVGGGLSGLSAAWFYREKVGPDARILVLDNHDDFGGHAKRNELHHEGGMLLGYGGTVNVENYDEYGRAARRMFRHLGIDPTRYGEFAGQHLFESRGLSRGIFLDRETFGEDRLVVRRQGESWADYLARMPLSEGAQRSIAQLHEEDVDYLSGMTRAQKRDYLQKTSYQDFLLEKANVHPDAIPFLATSDTYWGIGIDALTGWGALWSGYPGTTGLGFPEGEDGTYFSFPDGNSSIARLVVRSLIPEVAPPVDMESIVTARFDYSKLDKASSRVRLRLESTVIDVSHGEGADAARDVRVTYVHDGSARRVRASTCVLACYNAVIPHICRELPEPQRRALSQSLKCPLVYTNVLLRNSTAFHKLGMRHVTSPGGYHNNLRLARPMAIGDYRSSTRPEDPTLLMMSRAPLAPGLSAPEQWRVGRADLLATTFETFERRIRDQLNRTLSGGGFDAARDIEAITVNRWPHGYAYGQDTETGDIAWVLDEIPQGRRSWEKGRAPFGRIAIANSDAAGNAMTESAIGEAHRAVAELT